jgi:hypothetical protein
MTATPGTSLALDGVPDIDGLRFCRLAATGMDQAMLGVDSDNPTGALGLYQALGFEVDSRAETFGWPSDG